MIVHTKSIDRWINLGEKRRGLVDITYCDRYDGYRDDFWTYCLLAVHVVGEKETKKRSLYVEFS